jgi:general secretion pathway protein D
MLNLTREDYRHIAAPKEGSAPPELNINQGVPPIPKLADILAAPRPPKIGETQLVSIAVTDDVPLKDVLLELAKLADIDIDLDANIKGGVEFIAKDKPFNEVIDRICELAGLRYTMKGGVLHVERDTPFIQSYSLNFLNLDRDSDSAVNLSTNVLSSGVGGGGGGGGLNTGSTSSVKSKSTGDFWKSLEAGVKQVLEYQAPSHVSATTMQAEVEEPPPPAAPGATGTPSATAPGAAGAAGAAGSKGNSANNAAAAAKPATDAGATKTEVKSGYTINRQAGVLSVNGTAKQQELIQLMLEKLKGNASAQVLIEAKIIEVNLNEQYSTGIQWDSLVGRLADINPSFAAVAPATPISAVSSGFRLTSNINTGDFMTLLEAFGTVRTLSSPRLHAINNQQSTMTFAKNQVYFTITVTAPTTTTSGTTSTTPTAPTISSTVQTVPIGIMMTMMPSVDIANNEVTLAVRPTLSTIIGEENDPSVAAIVAEACAQYTQATPPLACPPSIANLTNQIPDVQVRELDSTLKLKSGDSMVIGGLMSQTSNNTDQGVPFLSGVPVVGNLFKATTKANINTELVLLIKATIVDSNGDLNKTDQNIFHKFSDDPRPVSF